MLSNKEEEGSLKKQGADDTDEEVKTERTIKNLRVTPSTPSEQHAELLHFIAKKECKVSELREELKRHEEELRLLKNQWETIVLNERMADAEDININMSPRSSISSDSSEEDEIDRLMSGLGKGINSVIDGISTFDKSHTKNIVTSTASPTSPISPISPALTDFSTIDSPATSTFTLPASPTTPTTPTFITLSNTLSASPTAPTLPNSDVVSNCNTKNISNNNYSEEFTEESLVYVIGDDFGDPL
ncbi:7169_t:CDS:2 [Acaulospora colombiana]|uniref:7169_t:CDS:1 n=1 Tax=Acaulospora colombiana TaxID=27376 RepID=A0ACA9LK55_9GLOM|nr:7169_t:CDS:2 [Acaulospora colombiana]